MHGYSSCVAQWREKDARALLALDFRTEEYRNELKRVAQRGMDCVPFSSEARFNGIVFVGGLAEALLERDLKGAELASAVRFDAARPPIRARDEGEYVGLCTVRSAPEGVDRLLKSKPAGKAEEKELKELMPFVSKCLSQGGQARFNEIGLRSLLAISAYRLNAHNSSDPVAGN
jgi:hypothetical protein